MLLASARLVGVGPFDDVSFRFGDPDARPRLVTVVRGGPCAGKTSLLGAIATTRPGHAVAQLTARSEAGSPSYVTADWHLGDDDPSRPHPLRVTSPNTKAEDSEEIVRRREQALYDRRAGEGGFAFVAFSGARWFSRTPVTLATPDRTILRYDVRASASFDDASRADLTRETKQAVVFSAIGAALARETPSAHGRLLRFAAAMTDAIGAVLEGSGFSYDGVDPARLEPVFQERGGGALVFDDLPRGLRHAIAFAALTLRALCAANPDKDPRSAEGVALIDDAEAQIPPSHQRTLVPRLRRALPCVQWILTTASAQIAEGAEIGDVIAIRRSPGSHRVEIYDGASAIVH